ncbi:hypothetical protein RUND412_008063 [Rhizina undulata]
MSAVPEIKVEPGLTMSNSMALVPDFSTEPHIPPPGPRAPETVLRQYRLEQVRDAGASALEKNRSEKATLEMEFTQKMSAMNPGEKLDEQREVTGRYESELEDLKNVNEELKKKVEVKEAAKEELPAFIKKSKPAPKPDPTPVAPAPAPAPITYENQSQGAPACAPIHQGPPAGYPKPLANSRLKFKAESVHNSRKNTVRFDTTGNKRDSYSRK